MNHWKDVGAYVCFAAWSLFNIIAAGYVSLLSVFLMSMKYDSMHTTSTALDPMPNLTRDTVVHNVINLTTSVGAWLLPVAALFWCLNFFIYHDPEWRRFRKAGFGVSCMCTFLLILAVVLADLDCLNRYPQR